MGKLLLATVLMLVASHHGSGNQVPAPAKPLPPTRTQAPPAPAIKPPPALRRPFHSHQTRKDELTDAQVGFIEGTLGLWHSTGITPHR
jgi:hypothetical protein